MVTVTGNRIVDNIDISIDQLLALRHITTASSRNTPVSNGAWLGNFRSSKRGHGSDYDDLRQYCAGDDVRHIDWRASARMQQLHTRLYREEQEHRTTVVCDLRHSMYTGSECLRANRAIQLTAQLLWQTCRKGTKLSLLIISSSGVYHIEPGAADLTAIRGCTALTQLHENTVSLLRTRNASATVQKPSNDGLSPGAVSALSVVEFAAGLKIRYNDLDSISQFSGPSLDTVLRFLVARSEHHCTVIWISAMDNAGTSFYDTLGAIERRNMQAFIYVNDPMLEESLPTGQYHYRLHSEAQSNDNSLILSASLKRNDKSTLMKKLELLQQTRIHQFDALMIPYLTTAVEDADVVAALQHQGIIP